MAKNQMAFPDWLRDGMSLRDWFAGQVLPNVFTSAIRPSGGELATISEIAEKAYQIADAMLTERAKR